MRNLFSRLSGAALTQDLETDEPGITMSITEETTAEGTQLFR